MNNHAFVGFDMEGTACIFIQKLKPVGDEYKGKYMSEAELLKIAAQLNAQKGWAE